MTPLAGVVVASLALSLVTALCAPIAGADPLSDAKAQAAALQSQVDALQIKAEQASENYDAAEAALGELVGEQRIAADQLATAQAAVDAASATVNERARALYMSGGTLGLYASVLQGADPDRLAIGLHDVQAMSSADQRSLDAIDAATKAARAAGARVDSLLARQNSLTAQADTASTQVQTALATEQQALDSANTQVRSIEAQIQAQTDADNAAKAALALAAARQQAVDGGFVVGPTDPVALAAITAASTQLGKDYVYGGSGPDVWDCSGLTQWAFLQAGVVLPRTAAEQYAAVATKVPLGELQAGDLLFWATDPSDAASIHHVAIYLGNGEMLAAPHTGTVVQIEPVYLDGYFGAVRPA